RNETTDAQKLPELKQHVLDDVAVEYLEVTLPHAQAVDKLNSLGDLVEMFFADPETMAYYQDPTRLAKEETKQKALQKEFEETFEDAIGKKAKAMADKIAQVKAGMQAARSKAATLPAEQKKNVFLGSKLVARYGCFACHNIHGFENAKSIGTDLSEWG